MSQWPRPFAVDALFRSLLTAERRHQLLGNVEALTMLWPGPTMGSATRLRESYGTS
jgi:hypothetical protein